MQFSDIIGQESTIQRLQDSFHQNRLAHAQLFIGKDGYGPLPLAIAYANYILTESSKDKASCKIKCDQLTHPDLHFAFPVSTNEIIKKHPISKLFISDWRKFIKTHPYGSLFEWLQHIGIDNKQGLIKVDEAKEVMKTLALKPFESDYKIMIIWKAEKLNTEAANKLLKLIEEPNRNTLFLLVVEQEEELIQTIRSRCQAIYINPIEESSLSNYLVSNHQLIESNAKILAHQSQGNYNEALQIIEHSEYHDLFEKWFITWVRAAFKAKGNPSVIKDLIDWSGEIAGVGRETQKQFLDYCMQFFRQALLYNYQAKELVFLNEQVKNFKFDAFSGYVHSGNIHQIAKTLEDAIYHIERNGNAKIILLDASIQLTRWLHVKEQQIEKE